MDGAETSKNEIYLDSVFDSRSGAVAQRTGVLNRSPTLRARRKLKVAGISIPGGFSLDFQWFSIARG